MITFDKEQVEATCPPAFRERCAVRITGAEAGENRKQTNKQIVMESELIGFFNPDAGGELQTEMKRGNITYKLAGLGIRKSYFSLTEKAAKFYKKFYESATGVELNELDETNPDLGYTKGLIMQALVSGKSEPARRQLTDEEREALRAEGKEPIGAPILDEKGNPITYTSLEIERWLAPYTGDLPEPY